MLPPYRSLPRCSYCISVRSVRVSGKTRFGDRGSCSLQETRPLRVSRDYEKPNLISGPARRCKAEDPWGMGGIARFRGGPSSRAYSGPSQCSLSGEPPQHRLRLLPVQNCLGFLSVDLHQVRDPADLRRLTGQGGKVVSRYVLQCEFPCPAHELAKPLGETLVVGV